MPIKKQKSTVVAGNKVDKPLLRNTNGKNTAQENGHTNGHADPKTEMPDQKELLRVLTEVKNGNFSVRMSFDEVGISGKICDTLNEIIALNEKMMQEFTVRATPSASRVNLHNG